MLKLISVTWGWECSDFSGTVNILYCIYTCIFYQMQSSERVPLELSLLVLTIIFVISIWWRDCNGFLVRKQSWILILSVQPITTSKIRITVPVMKVWALTTTFIHPVNWSCIFASPVPQPEVKCPDFFPVCSSRTLLRLHTWSSTSLKLWVPLSNLSPFRPHAHNFKSTLF